MILSGIILFLLCVAYVFIVYQTIVHRRLYWFAPTVAGFKKKKKGYLPLWESPIFIADMFKSKKKQKDLIDFLPNFRSKKTKKFANFIKD